MADDNEGGQSRLSRCHVIEFAEVMGGLLELDRSGKNSGDVLVLAGPIDR